MKKLKEIWAKLRKPSAKYSMIVLVGIGFVVGIIATSGFLMELKATASETFCLSCHEMRAHSYDEYKNSAHYYNASGVRAVCTDCHLARNLGPMVLRKIKAAQELFHHVAGTINTPEKFEERRLAMAERVWADMKDNNSRQCRTCHDAKSMDYTKQSRRAIKQHLRGDEEGLTCIECHRGVAHVLPEMETVEPALVVSR